MEQKIPLRKKVEARIMKKRETKKPRKTGSRTEGGSTIEIQLPRYNKIKIRY